MGNLLSKANRAHKFWLLCFFFLSPISNLKSFLFSYHFREGCFKDTSLSDSRITMSRILRSIVIICDYELKLEDGALIFLYCLFRYDCEIRMTASSGEYHQSHQPSDLILIIDVGRVLTSSKLLFTHCVISIFGKRNCGKKQRVTVFDVSVVERVRQAKIMGSSRGRWKRLKLGFVL